MMKGSQTTGIDWEAVKRRLRQSQQALDQALTPNAEHVAAVYRERAAQLAARGRQDSAAAGAVWVLVFALGEDRYALDFADLVELLPYSGCCPVPGAPPQLLGVINCHGDIRSVLDLGRLLELPERENAEAGYVLLLRKHGRTAALRVDGLDRSQLLFAEKLAIPHERTAGPPLRFLRGLTADHIRLLNTEALLEHPAFKGRS